MLVRFSCNAYGDITMFSDVAEKLLKMMGQTGHIPGAIYPEDVDAARNHLQEAIAREKKSASGKPDTQDAGENENPDKEPPIAIEVRAFPLLEMLEAASRKKAHVKWEKF